MTNNHIIQGDCVEVMQDLAAGSVDAIVTDAPYGISFMGRDWDRFVPEAPKMTATQRADHMNVSGSHGPWGRGARPIYPNAYGRRNEKCTNCGKWRISSNRCQCDDPRWEPRLHEGPPFAMLAYQRWTEIWATEALRTLKPGGWLASMGGTRTVHRLMCALEDAGFEIRDTIAWHYLSGFPKSHDVGLSVDKLLGESDRGHRIAVANRYNPDGTLEPDGGGLPAYEARTEAGEAWVGWGTALKPSHEPIILARKPLSESSVARNVLEHGCGGINVDGCRVPSNDEAWARTPPRDTEGGPHRLGASDYRVREVYQEGSPEGRWPANTLRTEPFGDGRDKYFLTPCFDPEVAKVDDALLEANGFYFVPKASRSEREFGCEGLEEMPAGAMAGNQPGNKAGTRKRPERGMEEIQRVERRNTHPTCKPIALFRHLVRLLSPPGGIVVDPFFGSGTTGIAAILEGFDWLGIEQDEHYVEIAKARTAAWGEKAKGKRRQLALDGLNGGDPRI